MQVSGNEAEAVCKDLSPRRKWDRVRKARIRRACFDRGVHARSGKGKKLRGFICAGYAIHIFLNSMKTCSFVMSCPFARSKQHRSCLLASFTSWDDRSEQFPCEIRESAAETFRTLFEQKQALGKERHANHISSCVVDKPNPANDWIRGT